MKCNCIKCCSNRKKIIAIVGSLFLLVIAGWFVFDYKSNDIKIWLHSDKQIVTTDASYAGKDNIEKPQNDCKKIEERDYKLLRDLNSTLYEDHQHNYNVFIDLIKNGCPENFVKHKKYAEREIAIITQTKDSYSHETNSSCMLIEKSLTPKLNLDVRECSNWECALYNAEIYLKLMKNGCPENIEKNKTMLVRELKLVLALVDMNDIENNSNNLVNRLVHIYEVMGLQSEADSLKLRYPTNFR